MPLNLHCYVARILQSIAHLLKQRSSGRGFWTPQDAGNGIDESELALSRLPAIKSRWRQN